MSTRSLPMPGNWRKSTWSGQNGDCVEVAGESGIVLVRDTKLGGASPVLVLTARQWRAVLDGVRDH